MNTKFFFFYEAGVCKKQQRRHNESKETNGRAQLYFRGRATDRRPPPSSRGRNRPAGSTDGRQLRSRPRLARFPRPCSSSVNCQATGNPSFIPFRRHSPRNTLRVTPVRSSAPAHMLSAARKYAGTRGPPVFRAGER